MYGDEAIQEINEAGRKLGQKLIAEHPAIAEKWIYAEANREAFYRSLTQDEFHIWQNLQDEADEPLGTSGAAFWGLLCMMYLELKKEFSARLHFVHKAKA